MSSMIDSNLKAADEYRVPIVVNESKKPWVFDGHKHSTLPSSLPTILGRGQYRKKDAHNFHEVDCKPFPVKSNGPKEAMSCPIRNDKKRREDQFSATYPDVHNFTERPQVSAQSRYSLQGGCGSTRYYAQKRHHDLGERAEREKQFYNWNLANQRGNHQRHIKGRELSFHYDKFKDGYIQGYIRSRQYKPFEQDPSHFCKGRTNEKICTNWTRENRPVVPDIINKHPEDEFILTGQHELNKGQGRGILARPTTIPYYDATKDKSCAHIFKAPHVQRLLKITRPKPIRIY